MEESTKAMEKEMMRKYPIVVPEDGWALRQMTTEMRQWMEGHLERLKLLPLPHGLTLRVGTLCSVSHPPRLAIERNNFPGEWVPEWTGARQLAMYHPDSLTLEVEGVFPPPRDADDEDRHQEALDQLESLSKKLNFAHLAVEDREFDSWVSGRQIQTHNVRHDKLKALHCHDDEYKRIRDKHPDTPLEELVDRYPSSFCLLPYTGFHRHLVALRPALDPRRHLTGSLVSVLRVPNVDIEANAQPLADYVKHLGDIVTQLYSEQQ